jgi:hypothetical protein
MKSNDVSNLDKAEKELRRKRVEEAFERGHNAAFSALTDGRPFS